MGRPSLYNGEKVVLSISISKAEKEKLQVLCQQLGVSITQFLRTIIKLKTQGVVLDESKT